MKDSKNTKNTKNTQNMKKGVLSSLPLQAVAGPFLAFLRWEASSGVILLFCAILALILANSPLAAGYEHILHLPIAIGAGEYVVEMGLLHWINDGLMAVFFFVIGLEIKREFLYGELRTASAMLLPVGAALGGMIVPAILYASINLGQPTFGGWGIPMATDIAFALGIMTIAARQAPLGLVVFLTALAIVDDLGAIVVIALFYNSDLAFGALFMGLLAIAAAFVIGRLRVRFVPLYIVLGLIAWYAFLQAGIHPTIAGVLLGLAIPAAEKPEVSLLHKLEHALEPWSAYGIMPIFALANAGVAISFASLDFASPIFLGIAAGLCLGKPLGIFGATFLLCKVFKLPLPGGATKAQLAATGMLGGIGFTMSIFIASLAFPEAAQLDLAKISILCASILSGILGTVFFKLQSLGSQPEAPSESSADAVH